jgi:hypothetical protein
VACAAVALPGCGLGEGAATEGEATLTVTRDFGREPMVEATVSDPPESETVIRMLDAEAEITTRYGGGFVQSIEGVAGEIARGRSLDWFFFVNGIESPTGAADVPVSAGDRIWWDYRDWTDAMRAPAVVGSWPEPFAQAATPSEQRDPVAIECLGEREPCDVVAERLADEDVDATLGEARAGDDAGGEAMRLIVGPWDAVSSDPVAHQLDMGPATSGVFARFDRGEEGFELQVLDVHAEEAATYGADAGLVAAQREGERPPTWLITGTDAAGVSRAAEALDDETLGDRYAVAVPSDADAVALPAGEGQ